MEALVKMEIAVMLGNGEFTLLVENDVLDFKIKDLVNEFVDGYTDKDETQVEWLITNIVEFSMALERLKRLALNMPEPQVMGAVCTNRALFPFPICWKCTHVVLTAIPPNKQGGIGGYEITGCKQNPDIHSWEDAKTMCPVNT